MERPTSVMWAVLALQGLRSDMERISGTLNDDSRKTWQAYSNTLATTRWQFLHTETHYEGGQVGIEESQHRQVIEELRLNGNMWAESHSTTLEEEAFREGHTAILEKFTAHIDSQNLGDCSGKAQAALETQLAIGDLFYNMLGDDVRW